MESKTILKCEDEIICCTKDHEDQTIYSPIEDKPYIFCARNPLQQSQISSSVNVSINVENKSEMDLQDSHESTIINPEESVVDDSHSNLSTSSKLFSIKKEVHDTEKYSDDQGCSSVCNTNTSSTFSKEHFHKSSLCSSSSTDMTSKCSCPSNDELNDVHSINIKIEPGLLQEQNEGKNV